MTKFSFGKFLSNVSDHRLESNRKLIGYLMHSHSDEKSFGVSIADNPCGHILLQAIKRMKTVVDIDCRKTDIITHPHAFEKVNKSVDIVTLKRFPPGYNTSDFRHLLANGISVESTKRYNQAAVYHPKIICIGYFPDKPWLKKIWLTNLTNPTASYKPFFTGWDEPEWNAFYNEIAACVKEWLK